MPGFNAAVVVEALDWSFEPFVEGAKGTIKEPTDDQIADYLAGLKKLTEKLKGMVPDSVNVDDSAELFTAINDLDPHVAKVANEDAAEICAALCSGTPSKETILKVPPRIRNVFFAWLQQEVMNPEVVSGGGAQQTSRR